MRRLSYLEDGSENYAGNDFPSYEIYTGRLNRDNCSLDTIIYVGRESPVARLWIIKL